MTTNDHDRPPGDRPEDISDRQLARRLGDALRALARVEQARRPRRAALTAAREQVRTLRLEMAERIADGRWSAWDAIGVSASPTVDRRATGSGSVYEERSRGRFVAEITIGGQRARKACSTKAEAEAWLTEARRRAEGGLDARESKWTVASWLDHSMLLWERSGLRPSTLRNHRLGIEKWWRPHLGHVKLHQLRTADVDHVIGLMHGAAPNTVRIALAPLAKAMGAAVREGIVARNPVVTATRPRIVAAEAKFLTPTEARALLVACADGQTPFDRCVKDVLALSLVTGLRRGEVLGLSWDAVDLDGPRPTLTVRAMLTAVDGLTAETKTAKGRRVVVLPRVAVEVLKRRRTRQLFERHGADGVWLNEENALVFTNPIGEPMPPHSYTRAVRRITQQVLGRSLHPHALRHTSASLLAESGVPLMVAEQIMGHASPQMTRHYSHVYSEALDRAASQLDRLLAEEG